MKPILEHLPRQANESFVARAFDYPYFPTPWHYHPELELVYIREGHGTRFIGDDISEFEPGNFAFIGANVPHVYRSAKGFYEPVPVGRSRSYVVHFLPESLGSGVLDLPEAEAIRALFGQSLYGLEIRGETSRRALRLMEELFEKRGLERWLLLVRILVRLAQSTELKPISTHISVRQTGHDSDRLSRVFDYVLAHYQQEIRLDDMAHMVALTPSSFSRYFRQRTKKSFVNFVTEVRLTHACKLLREGRTAITDVCFEAGFNNVSNFNRHFKRFYGLSPLAYQQQYREG